MKLIKYGVDSAFSCGDLAEALKQFFEEKKMISQIIPNSEIDIIVQAKTKDGYVRKIAGLERACTVSLKVANNILEVQVGEGKWFDKVAGAAIAWFITWPVALTTAYGAYKQSQLPNEVDAFIQMYLGIEPIQPIEQGQTGNFCASCGTQRTEGAAFCANCGTKF